MIDYIHISCKGTKVPDYGNQDYSKVVSYDDFFIAVIADGLGSAVKSSIGAEYACELSCVVLEDAYKRGDSIIETLNSGLIQDKWYNAVSQLGNVYDYLSTCSILFIDLKSNKIITGQIGDSLVWTSVEDNNCNLNPKEFLNETVCLGQSHVEFVVKEYSAYGHIRFILATDGISDEIDYNKIQGLLKYVELKYDNIPVNQRLLLFQNEIESSLGNINNDDKTIIVGWTKSM